MCVNLYMSVFMYVCTCVCVCVCVGLRVLGFVNEDF